MSCNNFVDCLLSALCGILIDEKVMYRVSSGPKDTPLTVVLHRRLMNIYFVINDFNLSSSLVAFIGVFFEPSPLFTIPFPVHITGGNTVYCCTGLICITLTKLELCITRETLCNPIGIIVSGCQGAPSAGLFGIVRQTRRFTERHTQNIRTLLFAFARVRFLHTIKCCKRI